MAEVPDGMQAFYQRRAGARARSKRHRRPFALIISLLVASLTANVILGVVVYDLRQDVDNAGSTIDAHVAEAEAELDEHVEELMAQVGPVDRLDRRIVNTERDIDRLEVTLFGSYGPGFENNIVGQLRHCINQVAAAVAFDYLRVPRCT